MDAETRAGQKFRWVHESEMDDLRPDGHPDVFVSGRRVYTHGHRNKGNRSLQPEYLAYAS